MCTAFLLVRRFGFQCGTRPAASQAMWFVLINALALAQTVAVSSAMLRLALPALRVHAYAEALAHATGVAAPVISSYFGHKWLTFR